MAGRVVAGRADAAAGVASASGGVQVLLSGCHRDLLHRVLSPTASHHCPSHQDVVRELHGHVPVELCRSLIQAALAA